MTINRLRQTALGVVLVAVLVGATSLASSAQAPAPSPDAVAQARAFIAKDDFVEAEKVVRSLIATKGATPEALEGLSWLGRGNLAKNRVDEALRFAYETERLSQEALKAREMDAEPRLPIAIGAAYEVQSQVLAKQGDTAGAVVLLQKSIDAYRTTSILARLQKNLNMLTLEGRLAPAYVNTEFVGAKPPALSDLRGKVTLLFFWAHWCPDCKRMAADLRELQAAYRDQGFVIVGPTQRYGYVAKRAPAEPAVEMAYIGQVLEEFYKGIDMSIPVSADSFANYGSSTTPTIVLVDRQGIVTLYHPGQMTRAELEPYVQKAIRIGSAAK